MKKIAVIGNNSGRNAGDAAILGCLLKDISTCYKRVEFYIPTINPKFVRTTFAQYGVNAVGLLPWNMSVKILGLPTLKTILQADLVLVTDAILFDRKLYNPLYNYLWTLAQILPVAKKRGIPVVLYNSSLGPARTEAGKRALKAVIDSAEALILRDRESVELLQNLGFEHPKIIEGADCALNAEAAGEKQLTRISEKERLFQSDRPAIGFNVNSYVDAFVRSDGFSFGRNNLIDLYAETVDAVIDTLDVDVIFVETQHMDMRIAGKVMAKIKHKNRIRLVTNKKYNYQEICSVLKRLELFVGMRTHSLILSSAMGTVPVGIITYPKNRGYMRTIGLEKNLLAFRDLSVQRYVDLIVRSYENREGLKNEMVPLLLKEKAKAHQAAAHLRPYLRVQSDK
ncbi:polysaccharide pyruvyl transferase family protein [candidate division KSB1 bacterium]|nr:polysaccharide pyruvyl transferase family protein [candidate division KSB1 bacterium]